MIKVILAILMFTFSAQVFAAVDVVYPEKYSCAALQNAVEDSGAEGLNILGTSIFGYIYHTFYPINFSCGKKQIKSSKVISSKDRDDCVVGILCFDKFDDEHTYYGH